MSTREKLNNDLKEAMKAKEEGTQKSSYKTAHRTNPKKKRRK